MPRFAANLSMLYPQHDFLERFAAAAADGFEGVEYLFPYAYPAAELKARLDHHGLRQVLFNAAPGDWDKGERGLASLPGREAEFRRAIAQAIDYAQVLGNRHIHVMAGLLPAGAERIRHRETYLDNLAHAAREAAGAGLTVLIEPINNRDMPGFFLTRQDDAQAICREVGADNLKVQFDCYHCQIVEGDLATTLRRDIGNVGHVQIAGVPDRHEPDGDNEVNYPYLFEPARPARLPGLDRLRVPPARRHLGGPGMAAALARYSTRRMIGSSASRRSWAASQSRTSAHHCSSFSTARAWVSTRGQGRSSNRRSSTSFSCSPLSGRRPRRTGASTRCASDCSTRSRCAVSTGIGCSS